MTYNLSNFTGSNDIVTLAAASNNLVDGWLFISISILVFLITLVAMKNYTFRESFAAASFISVMLNATLWVAGLIPERVVLIYFVLCLFAVGSFFID